MSFSEDDWDFLISRIMNQRCTPLLGPGLYPDLVQQENAAAQELAGLSRYPLEYSGNVARVAQYSALEFDEIYTKEVFAKILRDVKPPDFSDPNEPHSVLAGLPLPVYLSMNLDDFMLQALSRRGKKARREICSWNERLQQSKGGTPDERVSPEPDSPLVFHVYGHSAAAESVVLTEDDYLDLVFNIGRNQALLPIPVQRALSSTSLLILGVSLDSWKFIVLNQILRGFLRASLARGHFIVVPPPAEEKLKWEKFSEDSFAYSFPEMKIIRRTVQDFTAELRERLENFSRAS